MVRKTITVKINDKDYVIKEFTLQEIIDLTEGSNYFGKNKEGEFEKSESNEGLDTIGIKSFITDFEKLIEKSCNFKAKELLAFTPSQIRLIYDGFKEVNKDFLDFLKALGIMENLIEIKDMILDSFSKTLAISLNQDI